MIEALTEPLTVLEKDKKKKKKKKKNQSEPFKRAPNHACTTTASDLLWARLGSVFEDHFTFSRDGNWSEAGRVKEKH